MKVLSKAELSSARGDAGICFNVYEYAKVDEADFALVRLGIGGSFWPSDELLDSQKDLSVQVDDHSVFLAQLVLLR